MNLEIRSIPADLRSAPAVAGKSPKLVGHAALFNTEANLGPCPGIRPS